MRQWRRCKLWIARTLHVILHHIMVGVIWFIGWTVPNWALYGFDSQPTIILTNDCRTLVVKVYYIIFSSCDVSGVSPNNHSIIGHYSDQQQQFQSEMLSIYYAPTMLFTRECMWFVWVLHWQDNKTRVNGETQRTNFAHGSCKRLLVAF